MEAHLKRAAVLAVCGAAALAVLVCAALSVALAPAPAYAYVDPSVMTYTIQALAGVAVALGAVAGVAFRRTRKALFNLFRIDENRNKIVEGDVYRTDSGGPGAAAGAAAAAGSGAGNGRRGKRRASAPRNAGTGEPRKDAARKDAAWPIRFLRALPAAVFCAFTVGFVAPMEIVGGSASSLIYTVANLWGVAALAAVVIALALALIVSVFRGRAFAAANALVFSLGVCFYVQAMFMNAGLPSADGHAVDWASFAQSTTVSAIVWIAVIAVLQVLAQVRQRAVRVSYSLLAAMLIIVQAVGVGSIFASVVQDDSTEYRVTQDGLYEVSSKSNVIVFCLDTTDTAFLKELYEQDPTIFSEFTGFTWYQDNTGSLIPTRYGVPFLLTGQTPQAGESFQTYLENRYERSTFLDEIVAAGYSVDIYTDTTGMDTMSSDERRSQIINMVDNYKTDYADDLDAGGAVLALLQMALFRDCPWALKPNFEFTTDSVNNAMVSEGGGASDPTVPYTIDDAVYYRNLCTEKLSVQDKGTNGSFKFIHLSGSHVPYTLDANANRVEEEQTTLQEHNKGVVKIVSEYLRQLKELGVYDNSTIIVTADHGDYYYIDTPQQKSTSPIFMVKQAGTGTAGTGASGTGTAYSATAAGTLSAATQTGALTISLAPTSHMDFQATVLAAMGADYSAYGRPASQIIQGEARERFYYMTLNADDASDKEILEYRIVGNVLNIKNWQLTGRVWDVWDETLYPAADAVGTGTGTDTGAATGATGTGATGTGTGTGTGTDAGATGTGTGTGTGTTGTGTGTGTGAATGATGTGTGATGTGAAAGAAAGTTGQ